VLTADLVNARRRGEELHLVALDKDARARALGLAEGLIAAVKRSVGTPQEELAVSLAAVDAHARDYRMRDGFAKLLEDRCEFDAPAGPDPEEIRRDVFGRASAMRAALGPGEKLDRTLVLSEVARVHDTTDDVIERALFADLRGAQVLRAFEAIDAAGLVAAYERGQAQAVLLRAVKITVDVRAASAGATRAFFRRLKFLRLLHVITRTDDGYRVVIDGPFSMFESVTKYGLQLALVLPALEGCDEWKLEAEIRWGKEKRPLVFRLEGCATSVGGREPPLTDEIKALVRSFKSNDLGWRALPNTKILELPGVGLTVPDLVFERVGGDGATERIYLEVMGYWSRAAVWQRVELVQAGLVERVLFAVSSRLRVSEEVLDTELPSALYVYKGTMSARGIVARLDAMGSGAGAPS
jgi:predicted nuclease of restriction endonuclease-like RecB superfamily